MAIDLEALGVTKEHAVLSKRLTVVMRQLAQVLSTSAEFGAGATLGVAVEWAAELGWTEAELHAAVSQIFRSLPEIRRSWRTHD